jgi:hypothetical protein
VRKSIKTLSQPAQLMTKPIAIGTKLAHLKTTIVAIVNVYLCYNEIYSPNMNVNFQ